MVVLIAPDQRDLLGQDELRWKDGMRADGQQAGNLQLDRIDSQWY